MQIDNQTVWILIVEDEPLVSEVLEQVLRREKYNVVAVASPLEALGLVANREFAVIISDQRMPQMNGLDFLIETRKISPLSTRILISGVHDLKSMIGSINRGEIYRFITKPWLHEELIATVSNAIQKQQDAMNALISKVGNTTIDNSIHKTQKTFNLNLFLNEECKDAINWSDFIKNITVTLDDIDMTSNITDRVSYTICKELDKLGVYKRPIHCTDIKRHKACIKEGDEWKKEQDPLMKQGVTRISGKYQQIMNNWGSKHPMWHEDQELSEKMMSMMNIYMREPSEDKCISTILKHTTLKHIS